VEAAISPRSKALLLISPSNPTGGVIQPGTVKRLAEIAQKHDLLVIADELYEYYLYDDNKLLSIASLPGMRERTVTINGYSKCYGMTGWRVGYVTAAEHILTSMLPIHHGMNICAAAASQWGALAAATGPQDWFKDVLAEYDRRRNAWMKGLDEMGLPYGRPQGAYYIIFDIRSTGLTSQEFAAAMRDEAKVIVGGGGGQTDPYNEGYNRGSFVVPMDRLEEGLERMKPVVAKYQQQNAK
jgi:aminotransferase